MSSAGKIRIEVSEPYPVWCRLHINDQFIYSFHHSELVDLRYATEKAIQEAFRELYKVKGSIVDPKSEMQLP